MKIALAQCNLTVGDVSGNTARVLEAAAHARDTLGAALVAFPELTLTGYPPEDLLFHGGLRRHVTEALDTLCSELSGIIAVVGFPEYVGPRGIHNAAAVIRNGTIEHIYRKQVLPNYGVFDEKRYFEPGHEACVVDVEGVPVGLTICEDAWQPEPAARARAAGARVLLNINASPFEIDKQDEREHILRSRATETGLPLLYVNLVGGQDELVFDGGSCVMAADGNVIARAAAFDESMPLIELDDTTGAPQPGELAPPLALEASVYSALVLGTRDYVVKHGFPGVVIGLSGGIDSAMTLAIATDALGADKVRAVLMPSRYTSQMSIDDAIEQAEVLGVRHTSLPIEPMFQSVLDTLADEFAGLAPDTTEENIQARCRGILLMALSNKTGRMVLTTGNKSEMAVGYATLYGDMAGGFAPIKDCSKTLVYRLARYRNTLAGEEGAAIPERVITRPPTAELREDQKDSDSLPDYSVLDPILEAFIVDDLSVDDIVALGFERAVVGRVLSMVKRAEYKRRQAPPGVRISSRAFGRDWRYPITSGYRW